MTVLLVLFQKMHIDHFILIAVKYRLSTMEIKYLPQNCKYLRMGGRYMTSGQTKDSQQESNVTYCYKNVLYLN